MLLLLIISYLVAVNKCSSEALKAHNFAVNVVVIVVVVIVIVVVVIVVIIIFVCVIVVVVLISLLYCIVL